MTAALKRYLQYSQQFNPPVPLYLSAARIDEGSVSIDEVRSRADCNPNLYATMHRSMLSPNYSNITWCVCMYVYSQRKVNRLIYRPQAPGHSLLWMFSLPFGLWNFTVYIAKTGVTLEAMQSPVPRCWLWLCYVNCGELPVPVRSIRYSLLCKVVKLATQRMYQ